MTEGTTVITGMTDHATASVDARSVEMLVAAARILADDCDHCAAASLIGALAVLIMATYPDAAAAKAAALSIGEPLAETVAIMGQSALANAKPRGTA